MSFILGVFCVVEGSCNESIAEKLHQTGRLLVLCAQKGSRILWYHFTTCSRMFYFTVSTYDWPSRKYLLPWKRLYSSLCTLIYTVRMCTKTIWTLKTHLIIHESLLHWIASKNLHTNEARVFRHSFLNHLCCSSFILADVWNKFLQVPSNSHRFFSRHILCWTNVPLRLAARKCQHIYF